MGHMAATETHTTRTPAEASPRPIVAVIDDLATYGAQLRYNRDGALVATFTPDMADQRVLDLHAEMTGRAR